MTIQKRFSTEAYDSTVYAYEMAKKSIYGLVWKKTNTLCEGRGWKEVY